MRAYEENNCLVICLEGRIDSTNARQLEGEIHKLMEENQGKDILLDADNLTYISSAGLRVLLGIRKMTEGEIFIRNVSLEICEILEVSGLTTLMKVKKKPRAISVEGCPIIGEGAVGTVYRLDADTIVKVYNINDCLPMIENEQKRSRQALLKGIPTAIPMETVRVGDKYGSVFEMIKARNCNDMLAKEPGRLEEMAGMYAGLLKQVHGALSGHGEFPDARNEYIRYLDTAAGILPADVCSRIRALILEMPEDLHIIHGDIQLKNVMFSDGEMVLIDMETLSSGNPVFDLAGICMTYIIFSEDEPDNSQKFLGISRETCEALFYGTLRKYLNPGNEEEFQAILDKISLLGYVRFLFVLSFTGGGNPESYEQRINHSREHLEELSLRVKELSI